MNRNVLKLFTDVLSLLTAPYHEDAVADFVRAHARQRGLEVKTDKYGNVIVRYTRGSKTRPLGLTAHMDHPGFEVLGAAGRDLRARWLGGCDPRHFPGGRVVVVSNGVRVAGRAVSPLAKDKRFVIRAAVPLPSVQGAFGFWDLASIQVDGDILRTKSADNLAGCAAILAVFDRLIKQRAAADMWGIFTRAEEVGLVGAGGLLAGRSVPKHVPLIVLEASRALPGAEIGGGPVIRVGDRLCIFDSRMEYAMHQAAVNLRQKTRGFKFQRQLMSGGTCEASLYILNGYNVGALALPLGNYHNQGRRRPALEYISIPDAAGIVALCAELARHPPAGETRAALRRSLAGLFQRRGKRLLQAFPAAGLVARL